MAGVQEASLKELERRVAALRKIHVDSPNVHRKRSDVFMSIVVGVADVEDASFKDVAADIDGSMESRESPKTFNEACKQLEHWLSKFEGTPDDVRKYLKAIADLANDLSNLEDKAAKTASLASQAAGSSELDSRETYMYDSSAYKDV